MDPIAMDKNYSALRKHFKGGDPFENIAAAKKRKRRRRRPWAFAQEQADKLATALPNITSTVFGAEAANVPNAGSGLPQQAVRMSTGPLPKQAGFAPQGLPASSSTPSLEAGYPALTKIAGREDVATFLRQLFGGARKKLRGRGGRVATPKIKAPTKPPRAIIPEPTGTVPITAEAERKALEAMQPIQKIQAGQQHAADLARQQPIKSPPPAKYIPEPPPAPGPVSSGIPEPASIKPPGGGGPTGKTQALPPDVQAATWKAPRRRGEWTGTAGDPGPGGQVRTENYPVTPPSTRAPAPKPENLPVPNPKYVPPKPEPLPPTLPANATKPVPIAGASVAHAPTRVATPKPKPSAPKPKAEAPKTPDAPAPKPEAPAPAPEPQPQQQGWTLGQKAQAAGSATALTGGAVVGGHQLSERSMDKRIAEETATNMARRQGRVNDLKARWAEKLDDVAVRLNEPPEGLHRRAEAFAAGQVPNGQPGQLEWDEAYYDKLNEIGVIAAGRPEPTAVPEQRTPEPAPTPATAPAGTPDPGDPFAPPPTAVATPEPAPQPEPAAELAGAGDAAADAGAQDAQQGNVPMPYGPEPYNQVLQAYAERLPDAWSPQEMSTRLAAVQDKIMKGHKVDPKEAYELTAQGVVQAAKGNPRQYSEMMAEVFAGKQPSTRTLVNAINEFQLPLGMSEEAKQKAMSDPNVLQRMISWFTDPSTPLHHKLGVAIGVPLAIIGGLWSVAGDGGVGGLALAGVGAAGALLPTGLLNPILKYAGLGNLGIQGLEPFKPFEQFGQDPAAAQATGLEDTSPMFQGNMQQELNAPATQPAGGEPPKMTQEQFDETFTNDPMSLFNNLGDAQQFMLKMALKGVKDSATAQALAAQINQQLEAKEQQYRLTPEHVLQMAQIQKQQPQ